MREGPPLGVPPRSTLYSLPMCGDSGATQEGLLTYAQRLSVEHGLKVRDLFGHVILPEANLAGAFYTPGHFSLHAIQGCNGWSGYAQSFAAAMQRLTGRIDVAHGTLVHWGGLFSKQGYVSRRRKWCPQCLRTQADAGPYFFSLVWSFDAVDACPIHKVILADRCGYCGRHQPHVGDALAHGLCHSCKAPLHGAAAVKLAGPHAGRLLFNARAVANMVALKSQGLELARIEVFKARLVQAAIQTSKGSLYRLEKTLKLSYNTLRASSRHSLSFFLEILYRLGVEPAAFLGGSSVANPNLLACSRPYRAQRRRSASEFAEISRRIETLLARALAHESKATTRRQMAQDALISDSLLQSRFPEVISALRKHNVRVRPVVQQIEFDRRTRTIDAAMRELVASGAAPSARDVAVVLSRIGFHRRDPASRKMANEAIALALSAQSETTGSE